MVALFWREGSGEDRSTVVWAESDLVVDQYEYHFQFMNRLRRLVGNGSTKFCVLLIRQKREDPPPAKKEGRG
jgi:hypothetical protein